MDLVKSGLKMARTSDIGQQMRNDIIAGALPFGARLRIDELAHRYGVSHMPVREALRVLHGEGLVVIEPNRGARVQSMDRAFIEDLFDIRGAIETMLAKRAAERRTEAHIATLHAIEGELEARVQRGDYATVPEANKNFHGAINDAAGNPGALSIVERHWLLMAAIWQRLGVEEGRFPTVMDDHRQLIRAIERRDAMSASVLMGAHIERAKHDLLDRFDALEQQSGAAA